MPRCSNLQRERVQGSYSNDAFRMWDFKVKICPRTGPHDWTQCPFAHTGEKAKRRDLQQFVYSGNPCSDFEKTGTCPRGDLCPQAHGVFESWLHPLRYRTKLCKEGSECTRRVCFFAHNEHELRYLESGPYFREAPAGQLIRAFPEPSPYEVLRQAGLQMQGGLTPFQGDGSQQGTQMGAGANGNVCLSAAQLRWLAACIASMPQQHQEQMPAQLQGRTAGGMDMPLHDRSLSNSTITTDDDPIRADLSHGIMASQGMLDAGQNYFDPAQLPQQNLGQGLSLNQSLRSLGMDGAADLAGYAPHMGTVSSQGPIAMRHVRQDPQSSFSPESAYSQGLMGAPDWHSPQLMMSNAPDSYMYNHSFDLDMWN